MNTRKKASIALALAALGLGGHVDAAEIKAWLSPMGGYFGNSHNWSGRKSPLANDIARCNLDGAYTIRFTANSASSRFLIGNDKVVLDLNGFDYVLSPPVKSSSAPALALGLKKGDLARMTLRQGSLRTQGSTVGLAPSSSGHVTVSAGGIWDNYGSLVIGGAGVGGMTITSGGRVFSADGRIGTSAGARGSVLASAAASSWDIDGDLLAGSRAGSGILAIRSGAEVSVGGLSDIRKGGSLRLEGGTFTTGALANAGAISFVTGTLNLTESNLNISGDGPLGAALRLRTHQAVHVTQETAIAPQATLTVNNGELTSGLITNGGEIRLGGTDSVFRAGAIVNHGLLQGSGQADGLVSNLAGGEIRASRNQRLSLTGEVLNSSRVRLVDGGTIEVAQTLSNKSGAEISGSGTLVAHRGLSNAGLIAFSGEVANVLGDIDNNPGGVISVSGEDLWARFMGNVLHDGEAITVAPASTAVFNGHVSGGGDFAGGGHILFNRSYTPEGYDGWGDDENYEGTTFGSHVNIDGTVDFAPDAMLNLHIGPYDHSELEITGPVSLANVDIRVDDFYVPQMGDTFTLISAPYIDYHGSIDMPALGGDLSYKIIRGQTSLVVQVIPEPSGLLLAAGAGACLIRRRRAQA